MPIGTEETQNAVLDAWLGSGRAAGCPDSYMIEGWVDDPSDDDAEEADFDGYAAATWDSDDWGPADGGETETTALVSLGTPASDDSDRIRFWALRNVTSGELAFSAPMDEPVDVFEDTEVEIRPVVRWVRRS